MRKNNKLSELKALASKTVAKETQKANSIINQNKLPEPPKKAPEPKAPILKEDVFGNKATTAQKKEKESNITKLPAVRPSKRFQAVFKDKDFQALQQTKVFLLENGVENVSNNAIIQAALRAMVKDKKFVKTYLSVANEDQRRKYSIAHAV